MKYTREQIEAAVKAKGYVPDPSQYPSQIQQDTDSKKYLELWRRSKYERISKKLTKKKGPSKTTQR